MRQPLPLGENTFIQSTEEFRIGETILEQDRQSKGFYILEKGAVEIYKDGMMLNVLIYPGTVYGEIGDILGNPRTCTIKARSQTTVTKYDCSDLQTLVKEYPDVAVKIMETLASRLERTTQKLADISSTSAIWAEGKQ